TMVECRRQINANRFQRHTYLFHLAACLIAIGCQGRTPGETSGEQAPASKATARPDMTARFDRILKNLWAKDPNVRATALKSLDDFWDGAAPGSQVGLKALRAAARPYPFAEPEPGEVSDAL